MYVVIITNNTTSEVYRKVGVTIEQGEDWVNNHKSKGNDYTTEYIPIEDYERPEKLRQLNIDKDRILCATDWLFVSDVKNISQKMRKIYMEYRQYLRDLPGVYRNNPRLPIKIEEFDNWLKRNYPEEFMDGGNSEKISNKFNYYLK